jgi:very-short-patch-repair endonuclease
MTELLNLARFKQRQQVLRKTQTDVEALLWQYLRQRRLESQKFYRQSSIGAYIVDFYCPKKNWRLKWTVGTILNRTNGNMTK